MARNNLDEKRKQSWETQTSAGTQGNENQKEANTDIVTTEKR